MSAEKGTPPSSVEDLELHLRSRVREQTRCILAVLILAAEWHQRFPGGWVIPSSVSEHGVNAGGTDAQTRGRAIRRAWGQLVDECGLELPLQKGPTTGQRDPRRRRLHPVPRILTDWLYAYGYRLITRDSWQAFLEDMTRQAVPHDRFVVELDGIVAAALETHGRVDDALAMVEQRLTVIPQDSHESLRLLLLKSRLLLNQPLLWERTAEAVGILQDLQSRLGSLSTVANRLLLSRIHIAAGFAALRGGLVEFNSDMTIEEAREADAQAALERASSAEAFTSLHGARERAELQFVRARADLIAVMPGNADTFRKADASFGAALARFEAIGDYHTVGVLMYWLGFLRFFYHRVPSRADLVHGITPAGLLDALRWLEAADTLLAIAPSDRGVHRDHIHYFISVCCMQLLLLQRDTASHGVLTALVLKARTHLRALSSESWGPNGEQALRELEEISRSIGP